jgi:hypothetical protein
VLPKGTSDKDSNLIECLIDTLCKDGKVEVNGQEISIKDVIELPSEEEVNEEEEEKKEQTEPLEKITVQELFIINSIRNYNLGVLAVEVSRLNLLTNRLFTSFALSSQATGVSADAFNGIVISQGVNSKQALLVKNSILALLDKSAALGKKTREEDITRVTKMFNALISLIQYLQSTKAAVTSEINSEIPSLFADKKADSVQDYFDRENSTVTELTNGLNQIISSIISIKLETLNELGENTDALQLKAAELTLCDLPYSRLSRWSVLEQIIFTEEYLSYKNLKEKDDE